MQTSTITQKGQLTLPKTLRERLGIKTRDKLFIKEAADHIEIYPTRDILSMAGKLKPKKKKPVLRARRALEKSYQRI